MTGEEGIKFLDTHKENFEAGGFVHSQLTAIIKILRLTKEYKTLWEESQLAIEDVKARVEDAINCNNNILSRMEVVKKMPK